MNRPELDSAMRDILHRLALISHVPATSYQPRSRSGATQSRDLTGGDHGADEYAALYGLPFHHCTRGCQHRRQPATTDPQRLRILEEATDELERLTGTSAIRAERPAGETPADRDKRIVRDYAGWPVREVAVAARCTESIVRAARRNGTIHINGRNARVEVETGQPVSEPPARGSTVRDAHGRMRADPATIDRQARRRQQLEDLMRRGHTLATAARLVGVSRSTAERALGRRPERRDAA